MRIFLIFLNRTARLAGSLVLMVQLSCVFSSGDFNSVADPKNRMRTCDHCPDGALVKVTLNSVVGVVLDEFKPEQLPAIKADLLSKGDFFWKERARRQASLTSVRTVNRSGENKSALPITPVENWQIELKGKPTVRLRGGHNVVEVPYTLTTMIVSDADSPGRSEPALMAIGGTWDEKINLPVDPELLFKRTGYACLNESQFPPNSVDSEEINSMYDDTCEAGEATHSTSHSLCHLTKTVDRSCIEALDAKVGRVATQIHYERLAYNRKIANAWRIGPITQGGADMMKIEEQFKINRTVYRYIPVNSCNFAEDCLVIDPAKSKAENAGWHRLIMFTGSDMNVGTKPLEIGIIGDYLGEDPRRQSDAARASQLLSHHVFEFSRCHKHNHFMHYGNFSFGDTINSKRGFCLQGTNRFTNNEYGPLVNNYSDCDHQGVGPGWGDEYRAGLECQWVDVTGETPGVTKHLKFQANADGFLCEGTYVTYPEGSGKLTGQVKFEGCEYAGDDQEICKAGPFEASQVRVAGPVDQPGQAWGQTFAPDPATGNFEPVYKPMCNYFDPEHYRDNNNDDTLVTLQDAGEGFVTLPCTHDEIGPLRNCGFKKAPEKFNVINCSPGVTTTLSCTTDKAPQVARICDYSQKLKTSIPCTYQDALANVTVKPGVVSEFSMMCPKQKDLYLSSGSPDPLETGGIISVYQAPAYNMDQPSNITCTLKAK